MPRWTTTDDATIAAYIAEIDRVGPSIILFHSQAGSFGFKVAQARPDKVKALIAIEPAGLGDPAKVDVLKNIPTLIVYGDYIEKDSRWPKIRATGLAFADGIRAAGGSVDVVDLPQGRHQGQFAHGDDGQEQCRGRGADPDVARRQGADQVSLSGILGHRKRREMHGTKILEEADRLMTVCNSCRYCEGLCAVFPAMEMRRAFSDGDLNYFANLCHGCGACYTDCQFSPPHEFNVNVPQTLAIARAESYAAYAWPRAFSGLFARNGLSISIIAALSVAAFIFGFAAFHDRQVLFGIHTGPGAFYKLMPHNAMAALFGGGVSLCDRGAGHGRARVLARHRRADRHAGGSALALAGDQGHRTIALSRRRRGRLRQRGRAAERPAPDLSPSDLLRFWAVLRLDLGGDARITISGRARRRTRGGTCRSCSARSAASGC